MRNLYSTSDRLLRAQLARRRMLLESGGAPHDDACYLWRHHATTGTLYKDRYDVCVPFSENRFACFGFKDTYSNGVMNLGLLRECLPVINVPHASLTKTGTWAQLSDSQAYNGGITYSSAAATETISGTIAGHTLIVRAWLQTSGGYALVSIDGSPTAANRCPQVTQAQVTAGYFAAGDLGKRYVTFYASNVYPDEHIVLAEGLSDANHTVTLSAVGTPQIPPPGSSGKLIMLSALAGARYATRPTDSGGSFGVTREILNVRGGHSATTQVASFAPTGFLGNQQFLGENHLNETQSAGEFRVDGTLAAPAAGAYVTGKSIVLDRTTTLNHPNAAGCASKRVVYRAQAGECMQLSARGSVVWHVSGEAGDNYFGMLPIFTRNPNTALLENIEFNSAIVGDLTVGGLSGGSGNEYPVRGADLIGVYSTLHDTVALVHMPRPDLNVNSFLNSGPTYSFFRDVSTGGGKGYFSRSTTTSKETVQPGHTHPFDIGWRIFRLARASQAIELKS